ncbi:MAG: arylsulfatase [Gammaproteobacteria bacterium]|nr:arylsulfatase [Gammaproteobacteria bacterium]MBT5199585.1 arylsulfatase [Gammaproteobacteria bacterium]
MDAGAVKAAQQPNIILILADDLGFTDIAPYGSEISTPSLTALANEGIQFTNYHTAASCASSRAMLLTGVDNHRAGVSNIPEAIPPGLSAFDNYRGVLGNNVVTVATLLEDAGYHTYMAGKWHLGKERHQLPSRRGFERTVAMADTGADNWEQKPYIPIYKKANWFADGEEMELPKDFYSSRFLIDKTIEFIDSNHEDGQPFFAYVPFQAVHIPVQAPQDFIDRYMGVYDTGWEQLRQDRLAKAVGLGVVGEGTEMVDMSTTQDWDALPDDRKRYEAKRMAVYGGMIEAMDFHIGRLIEHLKTTGQYENTLLIFTSDNGTEVSGPTDPGRVQAQIFLRNQGYTSEYETLGLKGSFNSISPSFASASASPLAFYKFYAGEGGLRVPLIIAGQSVLNKGELNHALSHVTDITPTILSLAGVKAPDGRFGGRPIEAMIGRDLMPIIRGDVERVYAEDETIGYEVGGNAALFRGDYKIVMNRAPVGDRQWHLYNIVSDPGETEDLADAMPERMQLMLRAYDQYVLENGVLPVPVDYKQVSQVGINGLREIYGKQMLVLLVSMLILVIFLVVARSITRR